jgi:hypothetical protein
MASSNLWADLAATNLRTRAAHQDHEMAKAELKKLVPEDAKEATGHVIRAKRSKSGAISFDPVQTETPMHRSSQHIGAIAEALAKAQAELTNPEKTLTATIGSPLQRDNQDGSAYCLICRCSQRWMPLPH